MSEGERQDILLPASDGLLIDGLGPGHIVVRGFDVVRIRTIITIPQ